MFKKLDNNLFVTRFPPGHFYSPLPDMEEVKTDEERIWASPSKDLPGIDMNEAGQLAMLDALDAHVDSLPAYQDDPIDGLRFYQNQQFFSWKDAAIYALMIRHLRPKRIVEVGCGHSSHIALDTNQLCFDHSIELSFIDPYPQRFISGLLPGDESRCAFHVARVQDVDISVFQELEANDILFIDSSHVAKVGGDVNHLLFNVLPLVRPGVYVHVHDIFHPFEYFKAWVQEGRAWNEGYMLRAFLSFNSAFEIVLFNSWLWLFHRDRYQIHPMLSNPKGSRGSIWLRRLKVT